MKIYHLPEENFVYSICNLNFCLNSSHRLSMVDTKYLPLIFALSHMLSAQNGKSLLSCSVVFPLMGINVQFYHWKGFLLLVLWCNTNGISVAQSERYQTVPVELNILMNVKYLVQGWSVETLVVLKNGTSAWDMNWQCDNVTVTCSYA